MRVLFGSNLEETILKVEMNLEETEQDIGNSEMLKLYPIYMLPFLIEDL